MQTQSTKLINYVTNQDFLSLIFFTIFAKKAIREQGIPFDVSVKDDDYSYKEMIQSMEKLQKAAIKNGTADMSLEEINKEILRT